MDYVEKFRSTGLYSTRGTLLKIDLLMFWKTFHSDVDLYLGSLFEVARDVGTRGHRFKLCDQRQEEILCSFSCSCVEARSVEFFKKISDVVLCTKLLDNTECLY